MNRLFGFLIVLVICVAVIGFYRGWFAVSSRSPDAASQKVDINLSVDPEKMKADAETVKEEALELTGQAAEGTKKLVDEASESK
ncbi:MAG: hypothetical protein ABI614_04530 [Planctomycetota bacterium]